MKWSLSNIASFPMTMQTDERTRNSDFRQILSSSPRRQNEFQMRQPNDCRIMLGRCILCRRGRYFSYSFIFNFLSIRVDYRDTSVTTSRKSNEASHKTKKKRIHETISTSTAFHPLFFSCSSSFFSLAVFHFIIIWCRVVLTIVAYFHERRRSNSFACHLIDGIMHKRT